MNAAPSIGNLLARFPKLAEYTVAPPALSPFPGMAVIESEIRALIASAPFDARGYAMLGNLLTRRALYLQARDAYVRASEIDPEFAEALLAAADLSSVLHDNDAARHHLRRALAIRRRFDDPMPAGERTPVLLLLKDAPYAVNAPLELILDRTRVAVHKFYIGEEPREAPPEHAVAFVAFGYASGDDAAIEYAAAVAGRSVRTINNPRALDRCTRVNLATTLARIDGVLAASARAVVSSDLLDVSLPAVIRPLDSQSGRGLAYVETERDLEVHAQRFPSREYAVSPFIEYRSRDGYHRKYRLVIVNGVAFPYHLAISPRWIVHYQSSPMEAHEWMRAEEEAFLARPETIFPNLRAIAKAIAELTMLEYVGLDVARLPDGTMLVFEADPAMLVHDEDDAGPFEFKRPYVDAIRTALHRLIDHGNAP